MYLLVTDYSELWEHFMSGVSAILCATVYGTVLTNAKLVEVYMRTGQSMDLNIIGVGANHIDGGQAG